MTSEDAGTGPSSPHHKGRACDAAVRSGCLRDDHDRSGAAAGRSMRIAKRLPEGKVFAADIEPDMVPTLANGRDVSLCSTSCRCRQAPTRLISPSLSTLLSSWTLITTSATEPNILPN